MKFDQFAYWLQGHFELGALTAGVYSRILTTAQARSIKAHIQLYLECASREEENLEPFICWLDGILTYYDKLPEFEQESLVVELQKRLNNLFEHKIDPHMPGDKNFLQDIHDGETPKAPAPIFDPPRPDPNWRGSGGRGRKMMC